MNMMCQRFGLVSACPAGFSPQCKLSLNRQNNTCRQKYFFALPGHAQFRLASASVLAGYYRLTLAADQQFTMRSPLVKAPFSLQNRGN